MNQHLGPRECLDCSGYCQCPCHNAWGWPYGAALIFVLFAYVAIALGWLN